MILKYCYLVLWVEIRNRGFIIEMEESHSLIFVSVLGLCIRKSFIFFPLSLNHWSTAKGKFLLMPPRTNVEI